MARLQTFPDNFFFEGTMKRGMWQVGNAVPVKLSEHLGLAINRCYELLLRILYNSFLHSSISYQPQPMHPLSASFPLLGIPCPIIDFLGKNN